VQSKASLHRRWLWLFVQTENGGLKILPMPKAAARLRLLDFCCFPHASPAFASTSGKQKTVPRDRSKYVYLLRNFGAGEAIRTPDPNLGKVMFRRVLHRVSDF
jgi:hypothetical protein